MGRALRFLLIVVVVCGAGLIGTILLDAPSAPPEQTAITAPFDRVDFGDLPAVQTFAARDGQPLAYRVYAGDPERVAILIHGSSGSGTSMHQVAKALAATGPTVVVPDLRGHGASGKHGDIAYIGQLDDDLADLVALLRRDHPKATLTLGGFSSGGGFALRIAGGPLGQSFARTVLMAPFLRYDAPNVRPDTGGWTSIALPRIVALSILNSFGITALNGLPVIAFAVGADNPHHLTATYSFRLLTNFAPDDDYLGDLRRAHDLQIIAGTDDEIFDSGRLDAAVRPAGHAIQVTLVPGVGHTTLITGTVGTAAVAAAFQH